MPVTLIESNTLPTKGLLTIHRSHMLTDHALAELAALHRQLTGGSPSTPETQTMGERLLRLVDVLLRPPAPIDPPRDRRAQ